MRAGARRSIAAGGQVQYRKMPGQNIGRCPGGISDDTSTDYLRGTSKRSAEIDVDKTVFSRIPDNPRCCLFVVLLMFGSLVVGVVVWL